MIKEFKEFIARGNVIDMAVGIIIGAAFTAIVTSLVSDLINPIIGIITGGPDFSSKYVVLTGEAPAGASLQAAQHDHSECMSQVMWCDRGRHGGRRVREHGEAVVGVLEVLMPAPLRRRVAALAHK